MEASFFFGLSLALAIGPIAILIINQSVNCGTFTGILSGLGAALADFTYALVTFTFGAYLERQIGENNEYFKIFSSAILLILGSSMVLSSIRKAVDHRNESRGSLLFCNRPFITIYLMTIANPLTIIVFGGIAGQIPVHSLISVILCSIMLFAGSLLVQVFFATIGGIIRKLLFRPAVLRILNLLSGLAIIVISLKHYL